MDDNHRLEELLAYHYYLLKLRYVVINVDPKSTTSLQAIVDRWNSKSTNTNTNRHHRAEYDLNMTIVLWNDTDYINPIRYEFEQAKIGSPGAMRNTESPPSTTRSISPNSTRRVRGI